MLVLSNTHMLKNQESLGTEFQRYGGYSLCRESFAFCREVFLFAVRLMLLP